MKNIGIVPGVRLRADRNWYVGEYFFTDTYVSRVTEAGGLPIGLVAGRGVMNTDILSHCDALLLCGGQRILPYHLQAVDYAVKNHVPVLGVCLGMQAIHSYFVVKEEAERRNFGGSLLDLYETMKQERYYFVEPVKDRNSVDPVSYAMENIRGVTVKPGTMLSQHLPQSFRAAMRHSYRITKPASCVTVSALDEDGETIEGIEYGGHIMAVQFHPELCDDFHPLFDWLCR